MEVAVNLVCVICNEGNDCQSLHRTCAVHSPPLLLTIGHESNLYSAFICKVTLEKYFVCSY